MKVLIVTLSGLLGAAAMLWADPPTPPPGLKFIPALQDDFNGEAVDPSKWVVMERERKFSAESRDAVAVTNGMLRLSAFSESDSPGGKLRHYSGFLRSAPRYRQAKGYFEARIRMHLPLAVDSCFWLMPPTLGRNADRPQLWDQDGVEVDIVECIERLKGDYLPTIHWGDYGANHQSIHTSAKANILPGAWHTYGFLWDDSGYVFYCDSQPVARFTSQTRSLHSSHLLPVSTAPANIQLSAGPNDWAGTPPARGFGPRSNPTRCMDVDWVRVWSFAPAEEKLSKATVSPTLPALDTAGKMPDAALRGSIKM